MDTIAALDSILAMFAKCTRLLREAGMPEGFYQRIIDDKDFRAWLVQTCKDKLQPKVVGPPPPAYRITKSFTFEANYDDADNQVEFEVVKDNCYYLEPGMGMKNFPNWKNKKGVHQVTGEYVEFNREPTTQEFLAAFDALGLERPDIVEHRSFHRANPKERLEASVVSACGGFEGRGDRRCVAYVLAGAYGFRVSFCLLRSRWSRSCRFFGVRKPKALGT